MSSIQLSSSTTLRHFHRSSGPRAGADVSPLRPCLRRPLGAVTGRGAVKAGSAASWSISATATAVEPAVQNPAVGVINSRQFTPQPEQQQEPSSEKFNWYQTWYPVAALTALKTDAPNAVYLLGSRLVVWQDKLGEWRCFEDLCPHRLAPLSEGRIHESGQLQCSYHGWTFDEQGSCTSIPQINDSKAHKAACSSNRACVKAYPTQVLHDLVWVYADSSPQTWAKADAGKLGLPSSAFPEIVDGTWELKRPWFQRDVPLSFDVIMENATDPAHVAHSHHGVIGSRNSDHRLEVHPQGPVKAEGFKSLAVPIEKAGVPPFEVTYVAPTLVRWERDPTLTLNFVPTRKGWIRVFVNFSGPKGSKRTMPNMPGVPPFVAFILGQLDRYTWLRHIMTDNPILDGDTLFMHAAERTLYERGDHTSWSKQYYMPATADQAVVNWRKWLDKFGDTLPVLPRSAADLPPTLPREQVFDRYNQHTKYCPHCKAAMRNTELAIGAIALLAAVATGSFVVAAINAAAALPTAGALTSPAAAAAAAGGANSSTAGMWLVAKLAGAAAAIAAVGSVIIAGLLRLRQQFIFVDYVHAEH